MKYATTMTTKQTEAKLIWLTGSARRWYASESKEAMAAVVRCLGVLGEEKVDEHKEENRRGS